MGTRKVRCPICEQKTYFQDRNDLIAHIEKKHEESIPEGWEASRYENFLRTGKTAGVCRVCHKETGWNPKTKKYYQYCGSDPCRKALADIAAKNHEKKFGMSKSERLSNADVQRKMVYAKHTSGCYVTTDDQTGKEHKIWYDSSYTKDFLNLCDVFLALDMGDISGPSTNTYHYKYQGEDHLYIPDLVMHSLHLEIEIKDGGDNPNNHPKIQQVDKQKEKAKDAVMERLEKEGKLHYIKIVNKDYRAFFQKLMELRNTYDGTEKPMGQTPVKESFSYVDESIVTEDSMRNIKTFIDMASNIGGRKKATYQKVPRQFMDVIRTLEPKDVEFCERRMTISLENMKKKKKAGDKTYDLEKSIEEMEQIVLPAFYQKVKQLEKRRKEKPNGNNRQIMGAAEG